MPLPDSEEEEEDWPEETEIESDAGDQERQEEERRANNVATGARFGRLAPAAVLSLPSRTERVQRAKEQIASICQDIVADPENSLGLLRRLQTFTLAELPSPDVNAPAVPNDPLIRKLALLSLLSIFTDIVPSYRIRGLTEKEQAEKVSQMVARTREWEQGLVIVYKAYLGELEGAAKANNEMSDTAVRCLCTLLTDLTHFNFHTNIMSVVVARISRRSWDSNSELCRESIVRVFREDVTGQASLELVRLLNRMIKERKFRVRPNVLSTLLSLRLKTELGRPVDRREEQEKEGKGRDRDRDKGKKKGKKDKTYLSNKQRKALQETREIQKEMAEAEAQVDVEERDKTHTETLKLLFVLYFSILKSSPSAQNRLLPEALAGVSAFAHLINIDFFRDLLETLKKIARDADGEGDTEGGVTEEKEGEVRIGGAESELARKCRTKLLCVVTAFQLLTGQGEALNIDLAEFINQLYALLPVLGFVIPLEVDTVPLSTKATADNHNTKSAPPPSSVPSVTALLFRALHLLFLPSWHTSGTSSSHPPSRVLAFAKRLLALTLLLPPAPAIRTLEFLRQLRARESKLDGLFEEAEEGGDGVWRGEVDDPALANGAAARGWEVAWLAEKGEEKVREKARELVVWRRT
ncbi:NOC3p-domain-containing protein [Dacryopinax primogenitus]|uniref:Nucleolar complex-associated protein 3 n=1 Tax=Dacryopinax primogenitus (strain DJM 731) TaxID=1858805 RepID=M5FQA7_DACPD|nr:NOC3p-domain-containing protein [Dacryopinax primogenitus]EJT99050.1 NOC3p-domain-containing protein [Dacryopinax primogenitus]